ncbi:hypothetical protein CEXT_285211 [Caerostris extrusa]|uniref:Uncharacterized protein n=1 Tax=Caerostris extrusa TaxID=172846 RepID=A0AAV4V8V9_CAEEX|nr:hypothetical protein CEXT_285211 [Caerostris extrusa]
MTTANIGMKNDPSIYQYLSDTALKMSCTTVSSFQSKQFQQSTGAELPVSKKLPAQSSSLPSVKNNKRQLPFSARFLSSKLMSSRLVETV